MPSYIEVRAVKGRVARESPRGRFLPHDNYTLVLHTNYIDRLLRVHGDIEEKPAETKKAQAAAPAPDKA